MNTRTNKDITCYRSYLPDALRFRFEDKLTIRVIAQRLGLSHSTVHTLFQKFIASGISWPLPDALSFAQLDAILYANRKNETTLSDNSEEKWRKDRRASYSREFKVSLVKQALQPDAVVARLAREHGINDNLLFRWKNQYENGLLDDDDIQECLPVPVALTDTPEPVMPVTNPFWRNKPDEKPVDEPPGCTPRCELHLKSGVVKLFDPMTPELLRALIREMKGGAR
ncbi:TPA: transposase [Klebsiella oxytoca]|nr:transposase [Klebsiella oxytoca]HCQ8705907.1 transposase [Klebsiella oxytoca]